MPLTDTAIRAAKPKEKPYKIADSKGLYLFVQSSGARYWRYDYRFQNKRKGLAFGIYPAVSLAEARAERDKARGQIANGEDPSFNRKLRKLTKQLSGGTTFRAVAGEWLDKQKREGHAQVTIDKLTWLLGFANTLIGERQIGEITSPELLLVLRKLEKRERYETARRLRSTCGRIFRFAMATGRATADPTYALQGALISPKTTHRAAIVEAKPAGQLMRDIDSYGGQFATLSALKLAPHVFVRPGELRTAEWGEFDLDQSLWVIPAAKTKMRRIQKVPLSRQAKEILIEARKIKNRTDYVFPATGNRRVPLSENTLNAAIRRLGYTKTEMTAHGFRAMASSLLNEMGIWNPDAIERQLGHVEGNDVRRAYARAEFWDERVRMMQHWSDYLDDLRADSAVANGFNLAAE